MTTARLPGIYFETVPQPATGPLPRMDIAAFAGFAPSGPIDLPFVVEDPARFAEIFGEELQIAWDREAGEMDVAQMPAAVRSFFGNGGRRCWIMRLAYNAQSNAFLVPGLLQVDPLGVWHAGWVGARSEGSWSDGLLVNASLLEQPLPAGSLSTSGSAPAVAGTGDGDMVQVWFPSTNTVAYGTGQPSAGQWFWFQQISPSDFESWSIPQPQAVYALDAGAEQPLSILSFSVRSLPSTLPSESDQELVFVVSRDVALSVAPGAWLRVEFPGSVMLFQVESMEAGESVAVSPPSSPPATETAALSSTRAWWVLDPETAWNANRNQSVEVSIVTFQMWAQVPGMPMRSIAELGLCPTHPRFWGLLPTDAVLFAPVDRPGPSPYAALSDDVDHPRFPLAGFPAAMLSIPLGIDALPRPDFFQSASLPGGTALDRDGLASDQAIDLFIDSRLADSNVSTLLQDAFYWQYQAPQPSRLRGIHAILSVDEPSLLAVPDAVHRGWRPSAPQGGTLKAPKVAISTPNDAGQYTVSWSAVSGAAGYQLQESSDSQFAAGATSRDMGSALSLTLTSTAQCPSVFFYRVGAYGTAGLGAWSATQQVLLGSGDFFICAEPTLQAPELCLHKEGSRIVLEWTPGPGTADAFTLQIASDPRFQTARLLYQGTQTTVEYWNSPGPACWFRVAATRGSQSSPWSNTAATTPEAVSPWEVIPTSESTAALLTTLHVAMLRIAAARGDMVTVLSLPSHYHKTDAIDYVNQLTQQARDTDRMLSYGAVYHPWLIARDPVGPPPQSLLEVPPDGAVCGLIAARSLAVGAWIAPANLSLSNVVDLDPALEPDAPLAFASAAINLVALQPDGFLITGQFTLMDDPDLQSLNVRRLLILLRRLALREGNRYVFENVGPALQRQVTRQFEQWMQLLLMRGAFAGLSAEDSYRVSTGSSVNPATSLDEGRFVIELQVAPSQPMRFLTVRLVQSGGEISLQES
jgi:hypothetical protein